MFRRSVHFQVQQTCRFMWILVRWKDGDTFCSIISRKWEFSYKGIESIIIIPKVRVRNPMGSIWLLQNCFLLGRIYFLFFLKHKFLSSLLQLQLSLHLVSFICFFLFYLITNIIRHELQKAINYESFEIEEKASWHRCHTPFLFLHIIEVLSTSSWGYEIQCNQFGVR